MPWSILNPSQGGGKGAAFTWAIDLLKKIGAPTTAGNEQFVYDWEVSEGGGGKFNPLNQGPVPGDPSLTSTGQQYGGGAADFVSWDAGLQGAADYLAMPAYAGVLSALDANDPQQARTALFSSSWASSHYGYGSAFSDAALPGRPSALPAAGGSNANPINWWNPLDWLSVGSQVIDATSPTSVLSSSINSFTGTFSELAIVVPIVLAAGAVAVVGLIKASGHTVKGTAQSVTEDAGKAATLAAVA